MGSSQSSLTPGMIVAGAVGAGTAATYIVWAVARSGTARPSKPIPPPETSDRTPRAAKKPKKKGKDADSDFDEIIAQAQAAAQKEKEALAKARVVEFPEIVPGTFDPGMASMDSEPPAAKSGKKKKKAKKGAKPGNDTAGLSASATTASLLAESTAPDPGSEAEAASAPVPAPAPKKDKKSKSKKASVAPSEQPARPSTPKAGSSSSKPVAANPQTIADEGPWTRVETRRRTSAEQQASQADLAASLTSVTETSSAPTEKSDDDDDDEGATQEKRRTFAEKMLPKPRKTGVEDMLEKSQYPEISRVIRVKPGPEDKPAQGFTWADYEDVATPGSQYVEGDAGVDSSADGDDGGWGVVKSRKRSKFDRAPSSSSSVPGVTQSRSTAPETLTKRQRQNAAKRDAAKADKDAAEADRQKRLAAHKRELERTKMDEQWKKTSKKQPSGGMVAGVSETGSLVWD